MSTKTSRGTQSTAGGDSEQSESEKKLSLPEAVVAYLNVKDGESGSQQDLDDAVNAMVAALPSDQQPQSLSKQEQPKSE